MRHIKVVRLSALHTDRLYPSGNNSGTRLFFKLIRPQGHSAVGRITSVKKIEPATFRLLAQCLNQPRWRVLQFKLVGQQTNNPLSQGFSNPLGIIYQNIIFDNIDYVWTWGVPSRSVCEIKRGWSFVKHNSGKIKHIMW